MPGGWRGNSPQGSLRGQGDTAGLGDAPFPSRRLALSHHRLHWGMGAALSALRTLAWKLDYIGTQNVGGDLADHPGRKFCCDIAWDSPWDKQKHRPKLFTVYLVAFHYCILQHADASWHGRCNSTCHTSSSDFQEFLRHISFKKRRLGPAAGLRVHLNRGWRSWATMQRALHMEYLVWLFVCILYATSHRQGNGQII